MSIPLQALPEGLVGVDPGGHAPLQDVVIVPLPPKGLLKVGALLTQFVQAVKCTCTFITSVHDLEPVCCLPAKSKTDFGKQFLPECPLET